MVHEKVALNSAFKDREHTVFRPPDYTLVLLKLMRTIALWNKKLGPVHKVEILPPEIGEIIDEHNPAHLCEYRTVVGCLTATIHRVIIRALSGSYGETTMKHPTTLLARVRVRCQHKSGSRTSSTISRSSGV